MISCQVTSHHAIQCYGTNATARTIYSSILSTSNSSNGLVLNTYTNKANPLRHLREETLTLVRGNYTRLGSTQKEVWSIS